jgi:hypothetical protein
MAVSSKIHRTRQLQGILTLVTYAALASALAAGVALLWATGYAPAIRLP